MARCFRIFVAAVLIAVSSPAFCIISGNARSDGRPVMMKHRDSGELNNLMRWFKGPEYDFIGLVNASSKGGEVWAGHNTAGFCIINTATYDLKDDDVPSSEMDKEGELMFKALGHNVTSLKRLRFGSLTLPSDLMEGKYIKIIPYEK